MKIDDRTGRFPAASVSCGARCRNFVADPVVLFEILSESSEARDRGEKRREYQRLPSLAHYVLIDQEVARVEVYSRADNRWLFQEVEGLLPTCASTRSGSTCRSPSSTCRRLRSSAVVREIEALLCSR